MDRKANPTDVSDSEWALIAPYLTLMTEDAPQRDVPLREVFNGLRWIVRSGSSGSGANLMIVDNPQHDPTLFREARTLQRPSFQPSSYHSGCAMVCHLQAELSRRVRSDGGARRHGHTYHRFAMGPMLRSRLRENVEEICATCRLILESR